MIIKNVYIYNFILFDEVDVDLGDGMFFITGENRDEASSESNGSGKSTFCNAIVWAFFDQLLKKSFKKDDVIGQLDDWCQVCVTFIDDQGREIVVDRVRNHPERKHGVMITIDGEDKTKHMESDSNTFIEELTVPSRIVYHCAYSDSSKEPLPALTSANLNKVVSEILNTQRFDEQAKSVRQFKKDVTSDFTRLTDRGSDMISRVDQLEEEIKKIKKEISSFEEKKKAKISSMQEDVITTADRVAELKEMCKGKENLAEQLESLKEIVDRSDRLTAFNTAKTATLKNLEVEKVAIDRRYFKLQAGLSEQQSAYDNLFHNESGECGYCGNSLKASKKLGDIAGGINRKMDEIKAQLILVGSDRDNIDSRIKTAKEELSQNQKDLEECREAVDTYHKLDRKFRSIESVEKEITYLNKTMKSLLSEIEGEKKSTPDFLHSQVEDKEKRLADVIESVKGVEEQMQSAELSMKACDALDTALKNIKSALFNSFVVQLKDRINENLKTLTHGDYHCQLIEQKGELNLSFVNGSKTSYLHYHAFSDGERVRISKACSMALNEILNVGFIIDDEGLNGLDSQGARDVLDFVTGKSAGKSVFFVSHLDSVKDYFTSARNIHVIKENAVATVELR